MTAKLDILYSKFPWAFCFLFVDLAISLKIVYGIQGKPVTIRLSILSMPNMVHFVRSRQVSPTQFCFIFLFTLRADFNLTLTVPADGRAWRGAGSASYTSAHSNMLLSKFLWLVILLDAYLLISGRRDHTREN